MYDIKHNIVMMKCGDLSVDLSKLRAGQKGKRNKTMGHIHYLG